MAILGDTKATSLVVSGTSTLASINANSTGLGTNGQLLKSTGTGIAWVDAAGSHNHDDVYVNITGDTMTGALNFANNVYNKVGDDVQIGDVNQAGKLGIKGINGATGIHFVPYSGSTTQTFSIDGAGRATLTSNLTVSGTTDATSSTAATLVSSGGLAVAKKAWIGSGLGASSNNNTSSQLIISSSDTGSGGNVALELWRGTNASWQLSNEAGDLHIRTNYTTAKQSTYSVDAVRIAYNTGTITLKTALPVASGGTGATTFTSGALLIGNGTSAVGTRTIKNMTAAGNLGWTAAATDIYIPTVNTIAYWNGRYNATNSNLEYYKGGAFGTLAGKSSIGNHSYTPAGTNSAPAFTGTAATIVVSGGTGTATYTPAGTIAVNGTTATATVVKTATFNTVVTSASVANEVLTISTGASGSSTNQTGVRTADPAYKFTGTGTRLTASYTPAGSVAAPTFTGTAATLTHTIS